MNKTSMENKGWGEARNWQKQTLPRSRPTHERMRHCTDQQQHTTQYPPTLLNTKG